MLTLPPEVAPAEPVVAAYAAVCQSAAGDYDTALRLAAAFGSSVFRDDGGKAVSRLPFSLFPDYGKLSKAAVRSLSSGAQQLVLIVERYRPLETGTPAASTCSVAGREANFKTARSQLVTRLGQNSMGAERGDGALIWGFRMIGGAAQPTNLDGNVRSSGDVIVVVKPGDESGAVVQRTTYIKP